MHTTVKAAPKYPGGVGCSAPSLDTELVKWVPRNGLHWEEGPDRGGPMLNVNISKSRMSTIKLLKMPM